MTHDDIRAMGAAQARRAARDLLIQNQAVTDQRDKAYEQTELACAERDRWRDEFVKLQEASRPRTASPARLS